MKGRSCQQEDPRTPPASARQPVIACPNILLPTPTPKISHHHHKHHASRSPIVPRRHGRQTQTRCQAGVAPQRRIPHPLQLRIRSRMERGARPHPGRAVPARPGSRLRRRGRVDEMDADRSRHGDSALPARYIAPDFWRILPLPPPKKIEADQLTTHITRRRRPSPRVHNRNASLLAPPARLARRKHVAIPRPLALLLLHAGRLVRHRGRPLQLLCAVAHRRAALVPDLVAVQHVLHSVPHGHHERVYASLCGDRPRGREK